MIMKQYPRYRNHRDFAETTMQFTADTIAPLGDSAVRIACGNPNDRVTAERVATWTAELSAEKFLGITDVVSAYDTIVVHYDPPAIYDNGATSAYSFVVRWINERLGTQSTTSASPTREVIVPVVYDEELGPDLPIVAKQNQLTVEEVIRRHAEAVYTVRAIGFAPGFPYLDGLPAELATPRRATPRTTVPAGSVGIGGSQTGIYPLASPGGWNLIGRTPLGLFDTERVPAALLRIGDTIRFRQIGREDFDRHEKSLEINPAQAPLAPPSALLFEVVHPGMQTTIQDLGRWGHQAEGVTPGGVMDIVAARVANLLVGNAENTPLLEAVLRGPKLRFARDAMVAVTGAAASGVAGWRPLPIGRGNVLDCSTILGGSRIYIAVAGGIAADSILDGCGTDLNARFGGYAGRALVTDDQLYSRPDTQLPLQRQREAPRWFASPHSLVTSDPLGRIRIVRGPQRDWLSEAAWKQFLSESYVVSSQSNRMGIRLTGSPIEMPLREMSSEPVVFGAVQVPPDGQPIILAADRQTIGGYPVIACAITADRPLLAQLQPGSKVRFVEVSHAEAESLIAQCEHNLTVLIQTLPLRT